MAVSDKTDDVLIVGGGMAGLAAALSAAAAGASVHVVEKAARIGGNASLAAGMFLGSSDFAGFHAYIPDGDPSLQRAFCTNFEGALDWLVKLGLPLGDTVHFGDFRTLRPMMSGKPGDRQPFMDSLAAYARKAGATITTNARITALHLCDTGIAAEAIIDGTQATLQAKAVVIATGGFAANPALQEKFIGPDARYLKIRSGPGAVGEGIVLAQSLGAALAGDLTAFYGHTMADCDLRPEDWQPLTPYFARSAVLVNREGRRFVDESASLLEELNAQAGFRQSGGTYWLIFDERIRAGGSANAGSDKVLPAGDWLERARAVNAPLVEAATLPELVAKLAAEGVDAAVLGAELAAYNAACETKHAEKLQPPKKLTAGALTTAPFYALRCVAGITATCGGIAVDDHGRVLDEQRQPLPRVYAAGVDAGGVYGKTYGGFLAWALVSGRRAGIAAAAKQ
jgi:succinate dehydrogenase/fumarate reductase flavoprotein subunit